MRLFRRVHRCSAAAPSARCLQHYHTHRHDLERVWHVTHDVRRWFRRALPQAPSGGSVRPSLAHINQCGMLQASSNIVYSSLERGVPPLQIIIVLRFMRRFRSDRRTMGSWQVSGIASACGEKYSRNLLAEPLGLATYVTFLLLESTSFWWAIINDGIVTKINWITLVVELLVTSDCSAVSVHVRHWDYVSRGPQIVMWHDAGLELPRGADRRSATSGSQVSFGNSICLISI